MPSRRRLFAGPTLRRLRANRDLSQAELARLLGISASYLSQIEHNDRPLTDHLLERISILFPLDWQDIRTDSSEQLAAGMKEALSDPLFREPSSTDTLARIVEQYPGFARQFATLYEAYRATNQRLEMVDEAFSVDASSDPSLPWEEVRDWFHLSNNYVEDLDHAAEALASRLAGEGRTPSHNDLEQDLLSRHGVTLNETGEGSLREFDPKSRILSIHAAQPPAGVRFQLAYQLAALSLGEAIDRIAHQAELRTSTARKLLKIGLTNYAAGALLMPYEHFRKTARSFRHDIDRIGHTFGTSFEQTCHRLSTLQRKGAKGLPVFFCRVDMAGNITKRHSATRLQFARFGGACPLWVVHEAVAIPDRVLVQLAEMPDGVRYVSLAKGLVKPSGRFDRAPRRYAVALGCEVQHAADFIYADALDIRSNTSATKIGTSCRICPRPDCDQRAYPPSDRHIEVDQTRRDVIPYTLASGGANDDHDQDQP